jgi:hypothetical protein
MSSAGAVTITVDWAGTGDHTTIQQGINAAGTGDTVLVLQGTYTGAANRDLDFGGTNLLLVSDAGRSLTVIDCETLGRGFLFDNCEDTTSVVGGFTITNAAADSGAGAFCVNGSNPIFEDCLFLENKAQNRGGGLCCLYSSPRIRGCRFEGNSADDGSSGGYGGGLACLTGSAPLIHITEFAENESRHSGAAIYTYYAPVVCVECTFTGNNVLNYSGPGCGAALSFSDGAAFTDCDFVENGTAEVSMGAGLYVNACAITITDCAFLRNRAGTGAGIHFTSWSSGTVSGCTFAGNTTVWGACGGIGCFFGSNPTVTNCTFTDNQDHHIWCSEASPTIEYSILAFASPGTPVYCDEGTETPHIHHCFVCANAGGDTLCGGNCHDIDTSDPLFCDRENEEFTLCANSPCLPGETWPQLVGAHGAGCPPCESATEPTSWGGIKALYR